MLEQTVRRTWPPRRFLGSALPWRAAAYLVCGIPLGLATLLALVLLLVVGTAFSVVGVGIPLLLAFGLTGMPVAAVERWRLRLVDDEPVANPHRVPERPGLSAWVRRRFHEQATWRELTYAALLALVLWPVDAVMAVLLLGAPASLLATPVLLALASSGEVKVLKTVLVTSGWQAALVALAGAVLAVVAAYVITAWVLARAMLVRTLLAGRESELRDQVTELFRSRARLADAFEAERRRIERDLHDGAQQQLVALGMTLGLARLAPEREVPELVAKAHEQAKAALSSLGELIRGIHPRVLSDRGLPAAIDELADRSAVPVEVAVEVPGRLPRAVESAAYFVASEALTNVGKHSGARRAAVKGGFDGDRLVVTISDDGIGGVEVTESADGSGTGLAGLADRVAVVGGRLTWSSPPGGPTTLRLEVPCAPTTACASSSPRTAC